MNTKVITNQPHARQIILSGQVQGVGFRPFIYRLAIAHQLVGWIRNRLGIVEIQVQGQAQNLENFLVELFTKKPALAKPKLESNQQVELTKLDTFSILSSLDQGEAHISVPTDLFLCDDCLAELNNPLDRRYHYPFINCTQCGPRYTLIRSLPYDRANTSMATFKLCPSCLAEYQDPSNRRFHAEPIACPSCGPSLSFRQNDVLINDNDAALKHTLEALHQGKVVAVKGIGGYHLMCDATSTEAINRLRRNKPRPDKPLAVMFPAPIDEPFKYAELSVSLSENDKTFLLQAARPILLVAKTKPTELSEQIAPRLNEVGIMLPYSPLHHLLLNEFSRPLVATSANISGEPVLIHNQDVEKRLGYIADAFLHHNRPIERPADDPVYRTIAGKPRPIRNGRGSAPLELTLPFELEQTVLAVGAQMKNVIALAWKNRVVISPHIGEMGSVRSLEVFNETIKDLQQLYDIKAELIICDAHPSYTTTRWANKQNLPVHPVYHHHAHASAAYYECNTNERVIVFTWDGVGYGDDGSLWGGETFVGQAGSWLRVATMRSFKLPGGDKVGREPWRSAAALCWELGLECPVIPAGTELLHRAWQQQINSPITTSVGRLFDAAAALTGVCNQASFEGQAPMYLETYCKDAGKIVDLSLTRNNQGLLVSDWEPLIHHLLDNSYTQSARAEMLHTSMAKLIVEQAKCIRKQENVNQVALSGGVFQNRVLTETAVTLLEQAGFTVTIPAKIPINDAGISFGQVIEFGFRGQKITHP